MTELYIYDEIVPTFFADHGYGVSAKQIVDQLVEARDEDVTIRVNSPGGSVWEALAIESAIAQHGNVTVQIDGIAFSAATWLGTRAKHRTASPYAELMIHEPYLMLDAFVTGNAGELRRLSSEMLKDADRLERDGHKIAQMYADSGRLSKDEFVAAMSEETWYDAQEAITVGLVDRLMDTDQAASPVDSIEITQSSYAAALLARAPQRVRNRVKFKPFNLDLAGDKPPGIADALRQMVAVRRGNLTATVDL